MASRFRFGQAPVREINVLSYGADPTGVASSTAAFQAALDDLSRYADVLGGGDGLGQTKLIIPAGSFKLDGAGLIINGLVGATIEGAGKWLSYLWWNGSAGADMITMRNCRNVRMNGLDLGANGQALNSLIRMISNADLLVTDILSSHGNEIAHCIFRGGNACTYGLAIETAAGTSDYHNDYHFFYFLDIVDMTEAGVRIEAGQQKGSIFQQCMISNCSSGFRAYDQAGAFHCIGGFMSGNDVADFNFNDATGDAVIISYIGSEASQAFFLNQAASDTGNGLPLTILGCRWTSDGMDGDDPFFIKLGNVGPVNIQGNIFGFTTYPCPRIKLRSSVGCNITIQDNEFDSNDSVDVDPIAFENDAHLTARVTKRNNYYRTAGLAREMARRPDEISDLVYTSSSAAPTTTEIPVANSIAIHKNTNDGKVYLAYNDGGVIKKVELT